MKEVNFIAILGLCLICSPQAFGQNSDYIGSRLVIECQKEPRVLQDKVYKIYPFQKDLSIRFFSTTCHNSKISESLIGFYTSKPIDVNFRKDIPPKIIEEYNT